MITITQVTYILALWEHKNFQKAADSCFITQPTLSMQLKKAEESLGNSLFDRSSSPLSLTDFGKAILPELQQIQESMLHLEIKIKQLEGNLKEEIRIGIIPTIAVYLVPEFYSTWRKKLENISIEIIELKSEDLLLHLEERKIDFGIMAGPLQKERLNQQILFNESIDVFTNEVNTDSISMNTLIELHPWLLTKGNCLRTQMVNFCNINEADKDEWNYSGGNLDLLVKMVLQEGGYTLIPEYYSLPKELLTYRKPLEESKPYRQIIGVYNRNSIKTQSIQQIIKHIQSSKGKDFEQGSFSDLLPWS
jgi:LysR family hydrogen peroxide-inducible transcriptional activator